jgi:HTH-type transcriptional regulator/antitoxin HigA
MSPSNTTPFSPDYVVPPGETVFDLLEEQEMTQTELARRLGVSLKHVNQVIKGAAPISADLALGLEKVLGPSSGFWLTREALYQGRLAEQAERRELEGAIEWAKKFPIKELKDRDFIPRRAAGAELVVHLLRYLGIAHPSQWGDVTVAYRRSQKFDSDEFALSVWLRAGEIEAARIDTGRYDKDRFIEALDEARALTCLRPEEWEPQLTALCANAGVAVVIVDTFAKARANGAARWLTPTKALVQLSLRYRWEDIFWFSFFHEAGHLVLHQKKHVFVEPPSNKKWKDADPAAKKLEAEADRFASRTLIPRKYERRLSGLTLSDVKPFARNLGIAPAIVVGRLQHDGLLRWDQGNDLRRRFRFVENE